MNCCDYDRCTQGRNCPVRTTPASMYSPAERRAMQCQSDTDKQAASELPQPTQPPDEDGPGPLVATAHLAVVAFVLWLVVVVIAPVIAGWWHG